MPLLVVGSVAIDNVETPDARRDGLLGGSATHFSYAASFFTDVQLVGVVGGDWPPEHTELLASRGIDTSGLQVVPGGKIVPLDRPLRAEHERPRDARHRSSTCSASSNPRALRRLSAAPNTCSWPTACPHCS